jgi:predicted esterase YcpF (UPF0227 family)
MKLVVYIHGFNSSPLSFKANILSNLIQKMASTAVFYCPRLSHWPEQAVKSLTDKIGGYSVDDIMLIGSSLGGFYATYLSDYFGYRSVLINPAITPQEGLRSYIGPQKNLYTNEDYDFTLEHLRQLKSFYVPKPRNPERLFLIHTTGDELLDWKIAARHYEGAKRLIISGGDHGFSNFEDYAQIALSFVESGA